MADCNIHDLLKKWSLSNEDAYEIMAGFNTFGHIADDFVDGDLKDFQTRSRKMLQLLEFCLISLPNNPFYHRNVASYQPIVLQVLMLYDESNRLQGYTDEESQCAAFIFRGSEEMIFYHTAYLLGGLEHAALVREEYRQAWLKTDTFAEWKEEYK